MPLKEKAMGTEHVALTGDQKNRIHQTLARPALSPNFAETGEINPHMHVFAVHFDGTENDRANVEDGKHQTLVASLEANLVPSSVLETRYYPGIGTQTNFVSAMLEAVTGYGCEDKAEQAYEDLIRMAEKWRAIDPLAQVHVHVVGFSRGAASALHFMNLVDKRGIKPVKNGRFHNRPQTKAFSAGAVKTSAVLLDAVSTGQDMVLDLTLPPTAVSVLHIVAGSEERLLFPLTPLGTPGKLESSDWSLVRGVKAPKSDTQFGIDGSFLYTRLHQRAIHGARHSDIGDGYGEGFIGRVSEFLALEFQASLGLPVPAAIKPHFKDIQEAFGHDSRFGIGKAIDGVAAAFGVEDSRENVKRPIKDSDQAEWDGNMIQTACLTLIKKGVKIDTRKIRVAIPMIHGQPIPSEKDCNRRFRLDFHPASETREMRFSSRNGVFKLAPDESNRQRIMFKGTPIDDLDDDNSILQRVLAGDPDLDLHIDISYKRQMVPMFDVGQKIPKNATSDLDKKKYSPDPWPQEIQDCIKSLNAYPSRVSDDQNLSRVQALEQMTKCLQAAARTLKEEFPDTEMVRIRNRTYWNNSLDGSVKLSQALDVSCSGHLHDKTIKDRLFVPMFDNTTECRTGTHYALKARIQDMNDALNMLRHMFEKEGFDVAKDCDLKQRMDTENPGSQVETVEGESKLDALSPIITLAPANGEFDYTSMQADEVDSIAVQAARMRMH